MGQERRELHAGLPTAGELRHRSIEIRTFQLELAGHFAALPVGLAAIAHQKLKRRLAGEKRIVLPKIADLQLRTMVHFPLVEFLFFEQHAQERALAGPVAADEPDLHVVVEGELGAVE